MEPLKIGFVGGGNIARAHADTARDIGHDLVAVADIAPDAREGFGLEYGIEDDRRFESYETMLDRTSLDVVVVGVPNALHADCTIAALERNVNVVVEKPLAHTLDAALRIQEAERDSDATAMVGFMKSFESSTQTVLEVIDDGDFGDIYEINVEYVRRRGIPQIGSWFTKKNVSGGGAVVDIGPHMLHLALNLLDFPEVETISATAGTHFGNKEDYTYLGMWGGDPIERAEFDVDDHARALVRTEDAAIHLNVTWASNREDRQQVQVLGSDAGATFTPYENTVKMHSSRGRSLTDTELEAPEQDAFTGEWEYFSEVVRGEREHTINTVEQGVAVQRVIEGIYESAEREREIEASTLDE